ncbi:MAG: ATP-dependent RecD-like DNA helicase [Clostridia bacterium]|nr:ATP-dependent RecD-like DNA helicase [Clostridia bacterium]
MEITGIVDRIIYRNTENGYTVLSLRTENGDGPVTVCGTVPLASPGEQLQVEGTIKYHPKYGQQFIASRVETLAPSTLAAIESYLSGGTIRGIGPAMARLIVDKFGMDTLSVMEKQPERLLEVSGIGRKKLAMISNSFNENKSMREILLALAPYGVTVNQAYRIFKVYGDLALGKVQENPYQLIDDIDGIGFLTADAIAQRVAGFETNSVARLFAGIKYALQDARTEYGHTYLPHDKLIIKSCGLLGVDAELLTDAVDAMLAEGSLVEQYVGEQQGIFLPYIARLEGAIAQKLIQLSEPPVANPFWDVAQYERDLHLTLSESQRIAVTRALDAGVMIITGGPGTGKTTIIRCITHAFELMGMTYALAAPTGRAAKRMTEATGADASTIHRLLEYNPQEGFVRNKDNPLVYDLVIVDEMSMVDVPLMNALLSALPRGTRLLLVGDADQLPPVGCGDVLRDCLESGRLPVIRLTEIFRQATQSRIITNAHRIDQGQMPILSDDESDFIFEEILPPERILERVTALCQKECSRLGTSEPLMDVQVLAPMKKGILGVEHLNQVLQQALNPAALNKPEHVFGETLFREGDKIMQIKNDYKISWQRMDQNGVLQEGTGVFNGDLGTLYRLDNLNRTMSILFDDGRLAEYDFTQSDELDLAYCISIHKSQGSEFPTVLLPLAGGPAMLLNRNLLYTAVTRAKELVYCLGHRDTVARMVRTVMSRRRYTSLAVRLQEL